jgi:FlaA1/EpsC-like NDP-sugar epimerase
MQRMLTRSWQVALDFLVLALAFVLAFLLRYEFRLPDTVWRQVLVSAPYVLLFQYGVLAAHGVPRFSWRYVGMQEAQRMVLAMAVSAAVLTVLRLSLARTGHLGFAVVPLSVIAMDFVLGFVGLVGIRALRRAYGEGQERRLRQENGPRERVLLIGAGQAGVIVARELAARPDLGLQPVGFIDDNDLKVGTNIHGIPVLGTTAQLGAIAKQKHVSQALITIAGAPGQQIRRITMLCHEAELEAKIIPGIYEIVGGQVNLSRIREVAIEDVLGREPVHLDETEVSASVRGRVVLVTGAGGSIGSELCRQVCRFEPARLVLVERFENALFEIHRELGASFPGVALEPQVADVVDLGRMEAVFATHRPDVVFHAAAHKHVPMMEWNPGEAIKNNVGGTRVVADLSDRFGVGQFVMISTDKAVNPTSVMGASKRVAEIYVQGLSQRSSTRFVTVRFGNVLGSAGSVIPIFKEQISRGGPVTVTHPEMRRYFMTIPEASQLVLQAGAMGAGGEIFILDMGEPVRIVDLARDLITLSGLRPDEDIDITFSGMRPGEKLFEELSTSAENADKTKHPKIFIGRVRPHEWDRVLGGIERLFSLADGRDGELVRAALNAMVPEYTMPARPPVAAAAAEPVVDAASELVPELVPDLVNEGREAVRITSRKTGSQLTPATVPAS